MLANKLNNQIMKINISAFENTGTKKMYMAELNNAPVSRLALMRTNLILGVISLFTQMYNHKITGVLNSLYYNYQNLVL